jgi:uncharacterized protein YrrD
MKEGAMRTEVPIKAKVRCIDGVAGTSEAVILDPLKQEVTHLVLRERGYPHTERLVPIDLITSTSDDEIDLGCSIGMASKLDRFVEDQFVEVDDPKLSSPIANGSVVPYAAPYLWPFAFPLEKVLVTHDRVPKDELAVRRNVEVDATDGRVGRVEAFLVDRDDDRITHVVVRTGHLARREFAVPVSDVATIWRDGVVLRLDRREVENLPRVPYHRISLLPGIDETDGDLIPESPRATGVAPGEPDGSHLEGAHLLAAEADRRVGQSGLTRDQILDWAKSFETADPTGGLDEFVRWIDTQEHP